jgi:hypothetical protein
VVELTVLISEEVASALASEAERLGISPEEVAAQVLENHTPRPLTPGRLDWIGAGHSGDPNLSERMEDILRERFKP